MVAAKHPPFRCLMTDIPRDISPNAASQTTPGNRPHDGGVLPADGQVPKLHPHRPPHPQTEERETRRVGVEIEFAGLDVPAAAALVQKRFGGEIAEDDPHRLRVESTEFGAFVVELDARIVHGEDAGSGEEKTVDLSKILPEDVVRDLEGAARDTLGRAVTGIVPVEIVTPPIPWDELGQTAALTDDLREAGAKGTADNPLYGFGLHLNPELPTLDARDIARFLRAYFVLADRLREEIDIDMTRRLLPHSDPFPKDYVLKVLDPDYAPEQAQLIDDYLEHNPTRDRELDMLPLFRHLDEDRVISRLDDPLIKARPTFHYRLPNCDLGNPAWSPVVEWNRWVRIEELAADPRRLDRLARSRRRRLRKPAPLRWLDAAKAKLAR